MLSAIKRVFEGDEEIIKLYDPTRKVSSIDDVAHDIWLKLMEYDLLYETYFVEMDDAYFCYAPGMLISFGVHIDSRSPERLKEFFGEICDRLGGEFSCLLWTKNERAINWLKKMGMREEWKVNYDGHSITKLCL